MKLRMALAILAMDRNDTPRELSAKLEALRIRNALRMTAGVQKKAAKLACLAAPTLNKKIARYDIDITKYR